MAATHKNFKILIEPLILTIQSIPVASFIILCLIWISSKNLSILISFLMALPVVYRNILDGIKSIPRELDDMAKVFKVPAFVLSGAIKGEIPLNKIIDNMEKGEKIIKLMSISSYNKNEFIYFFTKRGMVKKTYLKEFEGNFVLQYSYKFK